MALDAEPEGQAGSECEAGSSNNQITGDVESLSSDVVLRGTVVETAEKVLRAYELHRHEADQFPEGHRLKCAIIGALGVFTQTIE